MSQHYKNFITDDFDLAPFFIKRYVKRRLNGLGDDEIDIANKYIYQITMLNGTAECAMRK